jgi:hypothetical protein
VTVTGESPRIDTQLAATVGAAARGAPPFNTEAYDHIEENGLRRVVNDPLSTFSVDVDTASYANVRRFLMDGSLPPAGAVRIEELINYFRFEYPQPRSEVPFSITAELSDVPKNDKKDAGEIGSGHSVTALYEIVPVGVGVDAPDVDPLKYQTGPAVRATDASELATVNVRYKAPDGDTSRPIAAVIRNRVQPMSGNLAFASAVAEFGMLLRESEHRGKASYESVASRARTYRGSDPEGYRMEFIKLVELAASFRRSP